MKRISSGSYIFLAITVIFLSYQNALAQVSQKEMQSVYNEVRTPYKYGIVLAAPDSTKMVDSPTIFRAKGKWYMTYIVFDGHGYETWIAISDDLLQWKTLGKIMSFTENGWDASQKAGYPSLVDINWGGSYGLMPYDNKYWVSYLGGADKGYEAGRLGVGMAYTDDLTKVHEMKRLEQPVLSPDDNDATHYDNRTIFKSSVIHDRNKITGHPFVMFYNGSGDSSGANGRHFESISMAVSDDMIHWKRGKNNPLITRGRGICGDAQVVKMKDLFVMFYFGYNWKEGAPGAFDRFACSYDLVHWTEWNGDNLIEPSLEYDRQYAHKPWMIKWKGVVYHFYNAVGDKGRVIALATSKDLKNSK
jgi:predicted GH43/DUF377 family glycosyl hydrolase